MGKVIAVGDYVKKLDTVEIFPLPSGDSVIIRVKKPSPEDEIKIFEMVQSGTKESPLFKRMQAGEEINWETVSDADQKELLEFSMLHTATQVSSCCFHPTMESDGSISPQQEKSPKKVWENADACVRNNSSALYEAVKNFISKEKIGDVATPGEVKK
jgi:hypothetical protein